MRGRGTASRRSAARRPEKPSPSKETANPPDSLNRARPIEKTRKTNAAGTAWTAHEFRGDILCWGSTRPERDHNHGTGKRSTAEPRNPPAAGPLGKSSSGRQGKPQKTVCKKRTTKSTLQKAVYRKQSVFLQSTRSRLQEADCKRQFVHFPAIKKDARPVANRACASFLFCVGFFFAGDDPPKRGDDQNNSVISVPIPRSQRDSTR